VSPSVTAVAGPLRFARYALPPNRLGYCGPDDDGSLFEQVVALGAEGGRAGDDVSGGLRRLAEDFEGAWPYLELIAGANGIDDPLDPRVVSAYWLGGDALAGVSAFATGNHVEERFRRRAGRWWAEVSAALEPGAEPSHAFHVMVVGPWVGLLRAGRVAAPLEVMDRCRIRWGEVLEVHGDSVVVRCRRVELVEGRLVLGEAAVESVRSGDGGARPCGAVHPGDVVSLHWDWVCEVLVPGEVVALRRCTAAALEAANRSLSVRGEGGLA
jgi:hypothetical protein